MFDMLVVHWWTLSGYSFFTGRNILVLIQATPSVLSVAGFPSLVNSKVAQLLKSAPVHNNEPQDLLEIIDMQIIMTARKT